MENNIPGYSIKFVLLIGVMPRVWLVWQTHKWCLEATLEVEATLEDGDQGAVLLLQMVTEGGGIAPHLRPQHHKQ